MLDRYEAAGAIVAGTLALGVKLGAPRVYLVPCGFGAALVVGIAARSDEPLFGTAIAGARAGAAAALVYMAGAVVVEAFDLLELLPPGFVADWVLFQAFALVIMLVPLYAIEGIVGAPAVRWLSSMVRAEVAAARSG